MPSLIRFFVVMVILAGLTGAGMVYLGFFVDPTSREMTVRIPAAKLEPAR